MSKSKTPRIIPKDNRSSSPFSVPVADLPQVDCQVYHDEFLSWLSLDTSGEPVSPRKDTILQHKIYPPVPTYKGVKKKRTEAPLITSWENLNKNDLNMSIEDANRSSGDKAYSIHIFLLAILNSVKNNPDIFIRTYAKKKSLDRLLDDPKEVYNKEIEIIEMLSVDLKNARTEEAPLIPTLFHNRSHGLLMYHDLSKMGSNDVKVTPDRTYEFKVSRATSNNFIWVLQKILNERKKLLLSLAPTKSTTIDSQSKVVVKSENGEINLDYLANIEFRSRLSRYEIFHLIKLLQNKRVFINEMSSTSLAKIIYYLTKYKVEKTRQELSTIVNRKDRLQTADFKSIKKLLVELLEDVNAEIEKHDQQNSKFH